MPLIDNGRKQNCKIQFYWIFPTLVNYSNIFAKYAYNLPTTKVNSLCLLTSKKCVRLRYADYMKVWKG